MKKIIFFIVSFFVFLLSAQNSYATVFDLIAPTGTLERGQEVKFTINIDTEGKSYTSTRIGMSHNTQYLQYVSVSPGNTFTTVSAEQQGDGKIILTGSSTNSFSGSGTFAYVTFKLIATAPGSTQLCVLYNPDSPTPTPTLGSISPSPSELPRAGINNSSTQVTFGLLFLILAGTGFFAFKNI